MSISLYNFDNIDYNIFKNKKTIVFMNGITGSGKSTICKKLYDFLKNNNINSYILSKDDFRYTDKGYIFEKEYEILVTEKYINKFNDLINKEKYKIIFLDNTHINYEKIIKTRDIYKNKELNELIISIQPFEDLKIHIKNNIHEVPLQGVQKQINEWRKNKEEIKNMKIRTIEINREKNNYFTETQINSICNIFKQLIF